MKQQITLLLLTVTLTTTSCVKELFKKKEEDAPPEQKYYGTWKATKIAQDLNNNNTLDANEIFAFTGNSVLQLNADKKFNFTLSTTTGSTTMAGGWTITADLKQITVSDATQGTLRFDYRTDTEFQTEPIPITNGTAWIIYNKQ